MIKKIISKILNKLNFLFILIKNFKYFHLFLYVLINKINVFVLNNGAIGHYPINLYLCYHLYKKEKNIFSLSSKVEYANQYLIEKMQENYHFDNRYEKVFEMMKAFSNLTFGFYKYKKFTEQMRMEKNVNFGKVDFSKKLFSFTDSENKIGMDYLLKNKITNKKFVCLLVRNAEYKRSLKLSKNQLASEENKHNYMNIDPKIFIPSVQLLIDNEFHIIRMGKGFKEAFPFKHNNFIDYAISNDRSDFLDVWLSANCNFFASTSNGIGALPSVFNKPCLFTSMFPLGRANSWMPKSMYLFRNAKKNGQYLTIKDLIKLDSLFRIESGHYDRNNINILEDDPDDLCKAFELMINNSNAEFSLSKLNIEFWSKMKIEWDRQLIIDDSVFRNKNDFDHFHKLDGIRTFIPDYFLEKYRNIYIDY